MKSEYIPENMTGQFAFSKAGHDKGTLYVIISQEDDWVLLCDGRLKTFAAPKKKKRIHIQPVSETVEEEILGRLRRNETVRDEEIKFQIKCWLKRQEVR